jgi:type IV fimbrial biogenesis protein FimT
MSIRRDRGISGRRRRSVGFTLVELVVTIAVLAILTAVAYPNMTAMINGQRLTSTANELVGALQIARNEAIRRNLRVAFCRTTNGTACATGKAAWTQWLVVAQKKPGAALDDVIRSGNVTTNVQVKSSVADDTLLFRSDGLGRASAAAGAGLLDGSITICIPSTLPPQNQRTLTVASGSRISTAPAGNGAGTCP